MNRLRALEEVDAFEWPAESAAVILEALLGSNEEERQTALNLAGDLVVMNEPIATALLAILGDRQASPDDRGRAAIALGPALEECDLADWDDVSDVPVISRSLYDTARAALREAWADHENPVVVRRLALEAAVRAPEPWQRAAITEAFRAGDHDWRLCGLFCAGYVSGFEMQVFAALDDEDEAIVMQAVLAASDAQLSLAGPNLLALADSDTTPRALREAAIDALGHVDVPGRERVLSQLVAGDDAGLSDLASFALSEMHGFEDVETWESEPAPD